ncbi:MAG: protein translocase subunit SecD [Oscillospiraceae bacterium]|nr:protein translocase subunit SecD [Oscillospiraceae bacterium]
MGKKISVFLVMLVVIALLITVAFTGVDIGSWRIPSVEEGIIPGLDLSGGTIITYEAQTDSATTNEMEIARDMLRQRLTSLGYTEASMYLSGPKRITIELPNIRDAEEAANTIGATAQLEFRTVADITLDQYKSGDYDHDNEYKIYTVDEEETLHRIWLTGDAVENAAAKYGQVSDGARGSEHYVSLQFVKDAEAIWGQATAFAYNQSSENNYIALFMDEKPVVDGNGRPFAPSVNAPNLGRECVVTFGTGSSDHANNFANLINIGKLPFDLDMEQLIVVGPTLGATALKTSLTAGAIGLGLMILFLIFYYRLPGLMAAIALLLYTALIALTLAIINVNLSLPGIAGIILSIGMAADANIVIFERLKEELRSGKTVRSSVDAGFKRARTAIIDSNLTTIISGFVLLMFGTGPIKGFAQTLLIGVVISMFTALIITHMLLKQMAGLGVVKLWFYGVREDRSEPKMQNNNFSFVKNFKWFGIPSLLICLFTVVALVLMPFGVNMFNFDIDFTGGTSFQIDIGRNVTDADMDKISGIVEEVSGLKPSSPQKVGTDQVLIKIPLLESDESATGTDMSATQMDVLNALKAEFDTLDMDNYEIGFVGASFGADLKRAAIVSVIVAVFLILLYITMRFQFSSGLASVTALIHDVLVLLAAYIIFQMPVNMTFIAVLLTTLGYQINATIILFDRVRENRKRMQKTSFADVIDRSIKQTLSRNINTTITTLFPVVCIIILGVSSVRDFALPIAIGLVAGAYSSVALAGSIWHKISDTDDKATKKLEAKDK